MAISVQNQQGAIPFLPGLVGGLLGGIGGFIPKEGSTSRVLGPASGLESTAEDTTGIGLRSFRDLVMGAGAPGAQDYNSYTNLLRQFSQTGGLPGQEDIDTANTFARNIFAPQQEQLRQSFVQQNTEAERLAARLGRPINDPILQAKLRTGFMNQQSMLDANTGSFAQNFALQLPGQRLGFAERLANQAASNRLTLSQLGSGILGQQQQFRLGASGVTKSEGGGLSGMFGGIFAGAGAGLDFYNKMLGGGNNNPPGQLNTNPEMTFSEEVALYQPPQYEFGQGTFGQRSQPNLFGQSNRSGYFSLGQYGT